MKMKLPALPASFKAIFADYVEEQRAMSDAVAKRMREYGEPVDRVADLDAMLEKAERACQRVLARKNLDERTRYTNLRHLEMLEQIEAERFSGHHACAALLLAQIVYEHRDLDWDKCWGEDIDVGSKIRARARNLRKGERSDGYEEARKAVAAAPRGTRYEGYIEIIQSVAKPRLLRTRGEYTSGKLSRSQAAVWLKEFRSQGPRIAPTPSR